jgi:hypothetical protein
VSEHERNSLVRGKREEGTFKRVLLRNEGECVTVDRQISLPSVDDRWTTPGTPTLVAAGIDEEPIKPSFEPIHVSQAAEVPPAADDCVLHRILSRLSVPQDAMGRGEQSVIRRADQCLKCLTVAPLCALNQVRRHRLPRRVPGNLPCCLSMAPAGARSFIRVSRRAPALHIGEDALAMPRALIPDPNSTLIGCRLLDELGIVR